MKPAASQKWKVADHNSAKAGRQDFNPFQKSSARPVKLGEGASFLDAFFTSQ
ncbi:hypothetical protein [Rhodobacter sp. JA431]|uniref:hypothetical protein n=1 Tax=Rhodobacter sp. JA431 TaxID=570013 RepID=UPI001482E00C|nr:hypothetical protein [Rhodobacter sp. JA431]